MTSLSSHYLWLFSYQSSAASDTHMHTILLCMLLSMCLEITSAADGQPAELATSDMLLVHAGEVYSSHSYL